jgi:restriction system protein
LTQAFTAQGYSVTPLNQPMADYLITQQGKTTLVCAKRWKAAAWGMEHMQSLVDLRDAHQASEVMCISLQTMPRALKLFATQNRINWLSDQALWALLAPVTPQPV